MIEIPTWVIWLIAGMTWGSACIAIWEFIERRRR